MESVIRDLAHGWRMLRRSPGFLVSATVILALGLGASTAVYSAVNAILLRPLPFPDQDRLTMLWEHEKDGSRSNDSFATFDDWRNMSHSFDGMAAISLWTPTLVLPSEAENLNGFRVSAAFFSTLGVRPQLGRDFLSSEDVRGNNRVAVISDGLWKRRFAGDPSIIGKAIELGSDSYTVVGVLPASFPAIFSFDPTKPTDIYTPLAYNSSLPYACRTCHHLRVVARIRDGVSAKQAAAEMDQISAALFA